MSIDLDAIAVAIAARFAPANVTPPASESNITQSTAYLPDAITDDRTLLVFPPLNPEWSYGPSVRHSRLRFPVRFFLWKLADNPRNVALLLKWSTVLYAQMDASAHLGLSTYVAWAEVDSGPDMGELEYGGQKYYGLEMIVGVRAWEGVSAA